MPSKFDPGYAAQPYRSLCENYPGTTAYPLSDFRVEWGPVFHRGRLDGSARVLIIGQDPAQHETVVRRNLIGEAGRRLQGFLTKLGVDRSYVMVNTFLYCLLGKKGNLHRNNTKIARYRNKWLDAIFDSSDIEAVVALGSLAESSWETWRKTPTGKQAIAEFVRITHPTQPESSGLPHDAAIKALLENWNVALQELHPLPHPDKQRPLKLFGDAFGPGDKSPIPLEDFPAGTPPWMAVEDNWAARTGTGQKKRRTITVTVPKEYVS